MRFELNENSSLTANDKMAEVTKPEKPLNEYVDDFARLFGFLLHSEDSAVL